MQVDQPNCKEASVMDPAEGHRYWRCSHCCRRCRRVAPNPALIGINYLRYYYNYLFPYWDYAPLESAFASFRHRESTTDATDGYYCYYYCYCCCWCS